MRYDNFNVLLGALVPYPGILHCTLEKFMEISAEARSRGLQAWDTAYPVLAIHSGRVFKTRSIRSLVQPQGPDGLPTTKLWAKEERLAAVRDGHKLRGNYVGNPQSLRNEERDTRLVLAWLNAQLPRLPLEHANCQNLRIKSKFLDEVRRADVALWLEGDGYGDYAKYDANDGSPLVVPFQITVIRFGRPVGSQAIKKGVCKS